MADTTNRGAGVRHPGDERYISFLKAGWRNLFYAGKANGSTGARFIFNFPHRAGLRNMDGITRWLKCALPGDTGDQMAKGIIRGLVQAARHKSAVRNSGKKNIPFDGFPKKPAFQQGSRRPYGRDLYRRILKKDLQVPRGPIVRSTTIPGEARKIYRVLIIKEK